MHDINTKSLHHSLTIPRYPYLDTSMPQGNNNDQTQSAPFHPERILSPLQENHTKGTDTSHIFHPIIRLWFFNIVTSHSLLTSTQL